MIPPHYPPKKKRSFVEQSCYGLYQILHVGAHIKVNMVAPIEDVWHELWFKVGLLNEGG